MIIMLHIKKKNFVKLTFSGNELEECLSSDEAEIANAPSKTSKDPASNL